MIIGVATTGATQQGIEAVVRMAVELGEAFYRGDSTQPRIDQLVGVVYQPDPVGPEIVLVAADEILARARRGGTVRVSCGSAACAYVAHARSRGESTARVSIVQAAPGLWHARALVRGRIWEPAKLNDGRRRAC